MKKLLLFLLLATLQAEDHALLMDRNFSPYMGAEDLITFEEMVEAGEARYAPVNKEKTWKTRLGYTAKTMLIWDPFLYTLHVVQHEVFGHGFRLRDFGKKYARITGYTIGVPPPWGLGGGCTSYTISKKYNLDWHEIPVSVAGVEANAILANRLKMRWLLKKEVSPRQALLYILSQHDLTRYTLLMNVYSDDELGHDIVAYHHYTKIPRHKIMKRVLINLFDPFTYIASYIRMRSFWTCEGMPLPMIPIGDWKFLPSVRLSLAPYGLENFYEGFFVKKETPLYVYLRQGSDSFGAGIELPLLVRHELGSAGFRTDIWNQDNPGFSFLALYQLHIRNLTILSQTGFKTRGFLPGESLEAGPIVRIGLNHAF